MLCAYIPAIYILLLHYVVRNFPDPFSILYTIIIYLTVAAATSSYKQLYSVCFYNKPFSVGRIRIVFIKHYEAVAVKLERPPPPPPPPPRLMWSRPSERTVRASTAVVHDRRVLYIRIAYKTMLSRVCPQECFCLFWISSCTIYIYIYMVCVCARAWVSIR